MTSITREEVNPDMNVKLSHIKQATIWAKGWGAKPLNGKTLIYDQKRWSMEVGKNRRPVCGTTCCIWGAAYYLANGKMTDNGPGYEWWQQSDVHEEVRVLLHKSNPTLPFFDKLMKLVGKKKGVR